MRKLHNVFLNIRENTWQLYNVFLHIQDQVCQFYNVFLNTTASSPLLGGLILSTPHTVLPKSLKSNIFANMPKRTDCDRGAQKQPNNKSSQIRGYQKHVVK